MKTNLLFDIIKELPPISLGIALAALLMTIVLFTFKFKDVPPGPTGLPYFGYWPFLSNINGHLILEAQKKKYGDIFSFTSCGRLFINLGSIKAVREAVITKEDCFGRRMSGYNILNVLFGGGVAFTEGEKWKVARKYFLVLLKERGANSFKTSIAGPLYDSIKSTVNDLKIKNGKPVNLIELLTYNCNTILRLTLFGDVGVSDEKIRKFNELYSLQTTTFSTGATPVSMLISGTFAKFFVFPFLPNYFAALKIISKIKRFLQDIIDDHKKTYDPENPRDIIDEYFAERDRRQSKGDPSAEYFTDKLLMGSLKQIFGDGILSVSFVTSMMIKHLLLNPEVQEKVYKEIVNVVGLDRQPTLEDKSKLTYFNAFILESLRMADFFNFFPSQECTRETTLGGYRIPKGAVLLVNFYSSHRDPAEYDDPSAFNPSRFMPTDGKKKPELPIFFGVGKRSCLGESYVMMQIFLLMTTLIQNFHLTLAEDKKRLSYEEFMSRDLSICAKPRHIN